jgi:hypothetical protein
MDSSKPWFSYSHLEVSTAPSSAPNDEPTLVFRRVFTQQSTRSGCVAIVKRKVSRFRLIAERQISRNQSEVTWLSQRQLGLAASRGANKILRTVLAGSARYRSASARSAWRSDRNKAGDCLNTIAGRVFLQLFKDAHDCVRFGVWIRRGTLCCTTCRSR